MGRLLSDVSEGTTPIQALFPLLVGQSIYILSMLLPLGFFLGVVFAFGRLYKDHELVVLQACGFSYPALYSVVIKIMLPVFLLAAWFSIWLSADMLQRAKLIEDREKDVHQFHQLKVGQFNQSEDKSQVFYMQSMSPDRTEIRDLIITGQANGNAKNSIETAERGRHKVDEKTGDLFLEVGPGKRFEGNPGDADYRIIEFEKHGILLQKKPQQTSRLSAREKSFSQLRESESRDDRIQLLWRINIPITLLVLGLLAVPLSYIAPRQGRFGKIGLALVIFILYLNLLGFSRSWMLTGQMPLWLNFWWVHALFIGLTIILLMRRTRRSWLFWRYQQP